MRTEHRRDYFEDYTLITIIASTILLFAGIVLNVTFIRTSDYDNYKIIGQKRMEAMEQSIIEYRRNHVTTISKVPFVPTKIDQTISVEGSNGLTSYTLVPQVYR